MHVYIKTRNELSNKQQAGFSVIWKALSGFLTCPIFWLFFDRSTTITPEQQKQKTSISKWTTILSSVTMVTAYWNLRSIGWFVSSAVAKCLSQDNLGQSQKIINFCFRIKSLGKARLTELFYSFVPNTKMIIFSDIDRK